MASKFARELAGDGAIIEIRGSCGAEILADALEEREGGLAGAKIDQVSFDLPVEAGRFDLSMGGDKCADCALSSLIFDFSPTGAGQSLSEPFQE